MVLYDPYEAQLDSIPGSGEDSGGLPLADETSFQGDAAVQASTLCKEDACSGRGDLVGDVAVDCLHLSVVCLNSKP